MQIALLVAAGVAFVGAFAFRSVKPDKIGPPWALFGVGVLLAGAAMIVPRLGGDDVDIAIVQPEDGATVAAGEPVTIEVQVEGGEIATSASDSGGHIHIFVDDSVVSMPNSTSAEVTLEPGEHELRVEYVDFQHASFDPPVAETIAVTAERERGG